MRLSIFLALCIILTFFNCKKEDFITDKSAKLNFSIDTLKFDTVFTAIGSATQMLKVYNPHKDFIKISSVNLAGGEASPFRLNIDGLKAKMAKNVEIAPKDSLIIFIEVTINPLGSNNPLVILDSIEFITNGNYQDIKLMAYGQDVHLFQGEIIESQTWINDKPYLIENSMAVDTNHILTIEAGVHVYFRQKSSSLIVWGTLIVEGTKDDPVYFQGDRLEEFYRDYVPAQWATIYIDPISKQNKINYAFIKNAVAGMQIGYYTNYEQPELLLSNTIIENISTWGIYAFGAKIDGYNLQIVDCGRAALALYRGGDYRFYHSSFTNTTTKEYPFVSKSAPLVEISNVIYQPELDTATNKIVTNTYTDDLTRANFYNCIIYGSSRHELTLAEDEEKAFNYLFDHSLLRVVKDSFDTDNSSLFSSCVFNEDPKFVSLQQLSYDLELDTLSPAKDAGNNAVLGQIPGLYIDFAGDSRTADGKPDMGAYERQE